MGLIESWVALRGPCIGWGAGFGRKGDREFYALSNVSPHCVGGMGWLEAVMGQREAAEARTATAARDFQGGGSGSGSDIGGRSDEEEGATRRVKK